MGLLCEWRQRGTVDAVVIGQHDAQLPRRREAAERGGVTPEEIVLTSVVREEESLSAARPLRGTG